MIYIPNARAVSDSQKISNRKATLKIKSRK
jgi:hypothetical protein